MFGPFLFYRKALLMTNPYWMYYFWTLKTNCQYLNMPKAEQREENKLEQEQNGYEILLTSIDLPKMDD